MTTNVTELVKRLREKQGGQTDELFTENLGVSRAIWCLIKTGERKPGLKFLKAVMRTYPEMTLIVMNFLAEAENDEDIANG
jgi:hypothetical protein